MIGERETAKHATLQGGGKTKAKKTPADSETANPSGRIKLPAGVVNVVTGDGITGSHMVKQKEISKIAFTGSTKVGKEIKKNTAGSNRKQ